MKHILEWVWFWIAVTTIGIAGTTVFIGIWYVVLWGAG